MKDTLDRAGITDPDDRLPSRKGVVAGVGVVRGSNMNEAGAS
jgi:hypothetical protein